MIIKYFFLQDGVLEIVLSVLNEDYKCYSAEELRTFYIRNESQIDKIFLHSPNFKKIIFENFEELETYLSE